MSGAWRYHTDPVTCLRIWHFYARVGLPEITQTAFACGRAAAIIGGLAALPARPALIAPAPGFASGYGAPVWGTGDLGGGYGGGGFGGGYPGFAGGGFGGLAGYDTAPSGSASPVSALPALGVLAAEQGGPGTGPGEMSSPGPLGIAAGESPATLQLGPVPPPDTTISAMTPPAGTSPQNVPEPSTWALMAFGLIAATVLRPLSRARL